MWQYAPQPSHGQMTAAAAAVMSLTLSWNPPAHLPSAERGLCIIIHLGRVVHGMLIVHPSKCCNKQWCQKHWKLCFLLRNRTDKHNNSQQCDKHWELCVHVLHRTDKHYHPEQRHKHWSSSVPILRRTDKHNNSQQCDKHWKSSVLLLRRACKRNNWK